MQRPAGEVPDRLRRWLRRAAERQASDLHVSAENRPRLRVVSRLEAEGEVQPASEVESMLRPILDGRAAEALDRTGYADFAMEVEGIGRLRVNVSRQRTGLKGCFRLVPRTPPSLDQLGLPREVRKLAQYHQGLAVVAGPTGHGKTTSLAAIVDMLNAERALHVITVEDPVEFLHPIKKAVITQRQVGLHTQSFQAALKGALREDPDVIVIGELRDTETVAMALSAAETGHLVLATMSTPSAGKTIDRLIDMFPPDDQAQVRATLAGALKMVIAQRLVPSVDESRLHAAAELITGGVPLWSLIRDNKLFQLPSLQQRGRNAGMIRIEDSLNELLEAKAISLDMARHFANDPRAIGPKEQRPAATEQKPSEEASAHRMRDFFKRRS